jgi:hypothetical protein
MNEFRGLPARMPKWRVSLVSFVSFWAAVSFVSFYRPIGSSMYPFLSSKRVYEPQKGYKGYKGYTPFWHSGGELSKLVHA